MKKKTRLFLYLGQQGDVYRKATYNGGGKGITTGNGASGGGASDLRIDPGNWYNITSLKSRIIVAGGGAGGVTWNGMLNGGHAGKLSGSSGNSRRTPENPSYCTLTDATGGTQTSGGIGGKFAGDSRYFNSEDGSFGRGGNDLNADFASGGGGGYYVGGAGSVTHYKVGSGAGGSSFISGHPGCDAISKDFSLSNKIHTHQPVHYSNMKFFSTKMMSGLETGYYGDGKAVITYFEGILFKTDIFYVFLKRWFITTINLGEIC